MKMGGGGIKVHRFEVAASALRVVLLFTLTENFHFLELSMMMTLMRNGMKMLTMMTIMLVIVIIMMTTTMTVTMMMMGDG